MSVFHLAYLWLAAPMVGQESYGGGVVVAVAYVDGYRDGVLYQHTNRFLGIVSKKL